MTKEESEKLKQYRIKLFRDAYSRTAIPERVPHTSAFITWQILDGGVKLSEALTNYDVLARVIYEHSQKYAFDNVTTFGTRNPIRVPETLGAQVYIVNDEKESISIQGYELLKHEELREFAEDPYKVLWEKCMPRKYPKFNSEMTKDTFQNTINEQLKFQQYSMSISKKVCDDFGYPAGVSMNIGFPYSGCEYLFSMLRGIKGFSISMRRDIAALKAAVDALDAFAFKPVIERIKNRPYGIEENCACDGTLLFLSHTVMNNKQFEYLYLPVVKEFMDNMTEKGKQTSVGFEGFGGRFYQYFADYPKGSCVMSVDQDDIFEMKKEYPQFAFTGGMTVEALGRGTVDDTINLAKKCINELGYDGGFVLCLNKMGSHRVDANPENLKALCDYMLVQD